MAVQEFPRSFEMSGVLRGLPDHVQDYPPEVHDLIGGRPAPVRPLEVAAAGQCAKRHGLDDGIRARDFITVEVKDRLSRYIRRHLPCSVPGGDLDALPGSYATEPVALVIDGEVLYKSQARPARGERGTAEIGIRQPIQDG